MPVIQVTKQGGNQGGGGNVTVNNPPGLIPQQTPAWCFAAAEQMARSYYGIQVPSQYDIARASVMTLVNAQAPPTFGQWNDATEYDLLNNEDENNGNNMDSARVQLVRNSYGAFNYAAVNGRMTNNYTIDNFKADIDNNHIVVIGTAIHYYVVYGYDATPPDNLILLVRDPWPAGRGGATQRVFWSEFNNWNNKVVIYFS